MPVRNNSSPIVMRHNHSWNSPGATTPAKTIQLSKSSNGIHLTAVSMSSGGVGGRRATPPAEDCLIVGETARPPRQGLGPMLSMMKRGSTTTSTSAGSNSPCSRNNKVTFGVVLMACVGIVLVTHSTTLSVVTILHTWPNNGQQQQQQQQLEYYELQLLQRPDDSSMSLDAVAALLSWDEEQPSITTKSQPADNHGNSSDNRKHLPPPRQSVTRLGAAAAAAPPLAVFYNVYVHPKDTNPRLIVGEQISYIGRSYAATFQQRNLTIYYNHIGSERKITAAYMEQLCQEHHHMKCIKLQHYDKADESATLGAAHSFCQHNPNSRIIYLHNKGSYHPRPEQKWWRQSMTRAVTSQDCVDNLGPDQCSTCGLMFWPMWLFMYPGNFFAAHCSYVRQLVPPHTYATRYEHVVCNKPTDLQTTLYPNQNDLSGRGRYALEAWIGTHPSFIPCDLSSTNDIRRIWKGKQVNWKLYRGVRHSWTDPWLNMIQSRRKYVRQDIALRHREYTLLPGLLWRWHMLYGQFPRNDSWVWTTFPDGHYWRDLTAQHGIHALNVAWAEYPRSATWYEFFNHTNKTEPFEGQQC